MSTVYELVSVYDPKLYNGQLRLSKLACQVASHPVMQRLKDITQLGTLTLALPNTNYSRFEHSCGVAHLCRYIGTHLQLQALDRYRTNKDVELINDHDILLLELAGLLHDVGHFVFSHTTEHYFHMSGITASHEARGNVLIDYIFDTLSFGDVLSSNDIEIIKYYISPYDINSVTNSMAMVSLSAPMKFPRGFDDILSSKRTVDADKMDYLQRDSIVLYGKHQVIDLEIKKIIDRSAIVDGQWSYDIETYMLVHQCILRRSMLFSNQYTSPAVSRINCMMLDVLTYAEPVLKLTDMAELKRNNIVKYVKYTDKVIIEEILNSNDPKMDRAKKLLLSILNGDNTYLEIGTSVSVENVGRYYTFPWNPKNDKASIEHIMPRIQFHRNYAVEKNISNISIIYQK